MLHHSDVKSQIEVANSDEQDIQNMLGEEEENGKKARNTVCGARQAGFAVVGKDTEDVETRGWLTEAVERGHCLEDWGEMDSGRLN